MGWAILAMPPIAGDGKILKTQADIDQALEEGQRIMLCGDCRNNDGQICILELKVSWTPKNPGRAFVACDGCKTFAWVDRMDEVSRSTIEACIKSGQITATLLSPATFALLHTAASHQPSTGLELPFPIESDSEIIGEWYEAIFGQSLDEPLTYSQLAAARALYANLYVLTLAVSRKIGEKAPPTSMSYKFTYDVKKRLETFWTMGRDFIRDFKSSAIRVSTKSREKEQDARRSSGNPAPQRWGPVVGGPGKVVSSLPTSSKKRKPDPLLTPPHTPPRPVKLNADHLVSLRIADQAAESSSQFAAAHAQAKADKGYASFQADILRYQQQYLAADKAAAKGDKKIRDLKADVLKLEGKLERARAKFETANLRGDQYKASKNKYKTAFFKYREAHPAPVGEGEEEEDVMECEE
ncbi:hypothetical protein JCM6882_009666 [Rhodosporidiobolus microsporus]